ncbi:MAG: sodium/solute symporter [Planctomycetes bacterium]|nr:sodium/solute symporter [Planctomycetota bacterium]
MISSPGIPLHGIDWALIVAYLVGIIVFGVYLSRRISTERDYFLGGRSLPFWAIGLSIVGSDIGAVDFVGLVGATYRYGLVMANMDWIGSMPALLLAAFVFVPYYWRSGVYSVPEYLGRRYNQSVRAIQTLAWTVFLTCNLGVIFWATSGLFQELLGWGRWEVILLTAAMTGIYTICGGLAAVVYSDVVQTLLMIAGGALVVFLGFNELSQQTGMGGIEALYTRVTAASHENHFSLYLPADSDTPYGWPGIFVGLTLVLAPAYFIANQAIVQRTLGARDEWSAKAGALFGCFFKFLIPLVVVLPGLIALALYPNLKEGDQAFQRLVRDLLPVGARGLVLAAFLAGLMSSVDSLLNSAATLITRDLWVGILQRSKDTTGDHLLLGRIVTLLLLIFGAATAPLSERFEGIYAAIQSILSIIQGPTLGLLLPGMFWARITAVGGTVALVTGLSVSTGLLVIHKLLPEDGKWFNADEPFFAIAGISFAVTVLVNVVVSLMSRPRDAALLRGLVYRWAENDGEVQDALSQRDE